MIVPRGTLRVTAIVHALLVALVLLVCCLAGCGRIEATRTAAGWSISLPLFGWLILVCWAMRGRK